MSSVGGRFGYPDRSPYATSKRGLIGFTETLALAVFLASDRAKSISGQTIAVDGDSRSAQ